MNNDTSSQLDVDVATSVIDGFSKAAGEFTANIPLCSSCSTFSTLANAGFTTSACTSYDTSIEELSSKISEMSTALSSYLGAVAEADQAIEGDIPDEEELLGEPPEETDPNAPDIKPPDTSLNNDPNAPKDGDNQDGGSGDLDDNTVIGSEPPLNNTGNNNPPTFEEITNEIEKYYNNIPKAQLEDVFTKLYEEAMKHNITIEELLSSDKYNEVILKLLKDNNLDPKELIKKYGDINSEAMRKVLLKTITGNKSSFGLSEKNKTVFNGFFNNYLDIKQISKEEFLKGGNANTQELLNFAIELSKVNNNSDVEKYINSLKLLSPEAILYELSNITK